ncbi:MAG: protein-tyrosine phosphatase-like protein, partial [Benjaminiella poitrasii]
LSLYQEGPVCILPNLYLGAHYNANNSCHIQQRGINCIINVASECKQTVAPNSNITYHHIQWKHNQSNLAHSGFQRGIEKIDEAHNRHQIVLVHCQQGIERSAALVLAFLLHVSNRHSNHYHKQPWSLERALSFVKERAPNIRPNMELMYQLKEFEESMIRKPTTWIRRSK